jgi:hypothetical protein
MDFDYNSKDANLYNSMLSSSGGAGYASASTTFGPLNYYHARYFICYLVAEG